MSQRKAKQARRQQEGGKPSPARRGGSRRWGRLPLLLGAGAALFAAAVGAGVVIAHGNNKPATVAKVPAGGPVSLAGVDPVTGNGVSLASYKGRPVVLNVWFSTCPGCNQEAPDLARFDQEHPRTLVGLDTGDTKSGARAFYQQYGWRHPSIFDPSGSLAQKFALVGFPTTIFLDRRHRIVGRIVGASDLAHFEAGLRRAQRS
jgi:thiol-disulfide isomerase/thioredoxin